VNNTTNWRPDPYGIHEFRFFSADGKPTLLVMDGGRTFYDKPPPVEPSPMRDAQELVPDPPSEDVATSPAWEPQPPAPQSALSTAEEPQAVRLVGPATSLGAVGQSYEWQQRAGAPQIPKVVVVHPTTNVEPREMEPLGRPLKIAFGIVFGLLAVSAIGLLIVHLPHAARPRHVAIATSTTASTHDTTTTTLALPKAPQASADSAANALVSSWSTGNKSGALTVATPAAVATLFATPYTSGLAIDRGCSSSFLPIVCTFGPPGGASPTDPIYQILVSQTSGGWYVSSVKIEN
jgi:hypothetical protein